MQQPKREGAPSTPSSLTTKVDNDASDTLGKRRGLTFTDRLGLRNPQHRKPLVGVDCLTAPFVVATEPSSARRQSSNLERYNDLVSLAIYILIAATNSANKLSSSNSGMA
jgi:hypothetical protein